VNEFDIIQRFFANKITLKHDHIVIGSGDDCAVISLPDNFQMCVSTDTFVEGVHFPIAANAELIAARLMAANLSDLAAMGAKPHSFTLAITSPEFTEAWLQGFSDELNTWVEEYQIPLVGGNLSKGPLSLTVNIMGMLPRHSAILRSGGNIDDDIYLSGHIGDAAGGLALLEQNTIEKQLPLLERYAKPKPRIELGIALREIASSAIDISDGFAADLKHLCHASDCGALISLEHLPLSSILIKTFGLEVARGKAVQGGDDYELCFTCPQAYAAKVQELSHSLGLKLTKVGNLCSGSDVQIADKQGRLYKETEGYQHF
jgi:thiamine-monophosphate kinase